MEPPVLIAGAAATLLLVTALIVVVLALRARRAALAELRRAHVETAELRERVEALSERLDRQSRTMVRLDDPAFVITDAGRDLDAASAPREPTVGDRVVLSAAFGEPLIKAVALGHGLRRALSAESRNTIRFEMRREVRRARKQRRREMKQAWRQMQAADRAEQAQDQPTTYAEPQPVSVR